MKTRLERARHSLLGCRKSTALRVLPLALIAMGSLRAATIDTVTANAPTYEVGSGSIYAVGGIATGGLVKFAGPGAAACESLASSCALVFSFDVVHNSGPAVFLYFEYTITSLNDVVWNVTSGKDVYAEGTAVAGISVPVSGSAVVPNGSIRFYFSSTGSFTVDIPTNSIDFSASSTSSGVPEPSTVALTLSGAAALALLRRRRK